MREPELLLLDEPTAGLDIGAREQVLGDLAALLADAGAPPMVIVTHHLEEIPAGCTPRVALTHGRVVAQGPILDILTSDTLTACYGLPLEVIHDRADASPPASRNRALTHTRWVRVAVAVSSGRRSCRRV